MEQLRQRVLCVRVGFYDEDNDTIVPREISEDYEDIHDLITSQ